MDLIRELETIRPDPQIAFNGYHPDWGSDLLYLIIQPQQSTVVRERMLVLAYIEGTSPEEPSRLYALIERHSAFRRRFRILSTEDTNAALIRELSRDENARVATWGSTPEAAFSAIRGSFSSDKRTHPLQDFISALRQYLDPAAKRDHDDGGNVPVLV